MTPDIVIATLPDLPYFDDLQNRHRWALGFLPSQAQRQYIESRHALLLRHNNEPAGFLVWRKTWHPLVTMAHTGIQILQVCVEPGLRRVLHATRLLDALDSQVAQAAPLYMRCWCATDLDANCFWRALGFHRDMTRDLTRAGRVRRSHHHWTRPEF